ncbi:PLC-like phosphodiesterase, TIM beta/alpha-barrel domain [Pseudocohnilembus persalinus]|uniref:Transmembrane protein 231 n=1 Tax=Pseudocohnilembus persalinus TaxID=266149 RepID=A0A0V0R6P7_PSEPJ|nr:PLC-like phosphodiesterase, TIM beta/alpha-barrel domain [Pseudocohnilembus persalinus]|eukprot:KRX10147.1 PLC-like phosphodiesterase, TIM beta/alpha-barrel domain [Pseudocohnilembus persalinus]
MIQNNESIYNILPAEKIEYPKGPIYKSRYPGILPPTGSTFGTKNTTVPGIQNCGGYINNPIVNHSPTNQGASFGKIIDVRKSIDPKIFMKKGEGLVCSNAKLQRLEIQKNQSAVFNNRYNKPLCQLASNSILSPIDSHKYKNKEPVPKHNEKPIYGLKSNKNFIIENSIANILSCNIWFYEIQQTIYKIYMYFSNIISQNKFNMIAPPIKNEKVEYTKKPDYGQIPSYLYRRKQQINTEASLVKTFFEQEAEKNNHVKQVPDDEIKKLKAGLKEKWDEVNKKYQKYTYLNELDSLVKIRNFSKVYQEQPYVNFRGSYLLNCYGEGNQYTYTNIYPLNITNTDNFEPSLSVLKQDDNVDQKYDRFEITINVQKKINTCQIYLIADYGLRENVRLQMQSPIKFEISAKNYINQATILGDITFNQRNPIQSSPILRTNYNQTIDIDQYSDFTYLEFLQEFNSRNETCFSNYQTLITQSESSTSLTVKMYLDERVQKKFNVQQIDTLQSNDFLNLQSGQKINQRYQNIMQKDDSENQYSDQQDDEMFQTCQNYHDYKDEQMFQQSNNSNNNFKHQISQNENFIQNKNYQQEQLNLNFVQDSKQIIDNNQNKKIIRSNKIEEPYQKYQLKNSNDQFDSIKEIIHYPYQKFNTISKNQQDQIDSQNYKNVQADQRNLNKAYNVIKSKEFDEKFDNKWQEQSKKELLQTNIIQKSMNANQQIKPDNNKQGSLDNLNKNQNQKINNEPEFQFTFQKKQQQNPIYDNDVIQPIIKPPQNYENIVEQNNNNTFDQNFENIDNKSDKNSNNFASQNSLQDYLDNINGNKNSNNNCSFIKNKQEKVQNKVFPIFKKQNFEDSYGKNQSNLFQNNDNEFQFEKSDLKENSNIDEGFGLNSTHQSKFQQQNNQSQYQSFQVQNQNIDNETNFQQQNINGITQKTFNGTKINEQALFNGKRNQQKQIEVGQSQIRKSSSQLLASSQKQEKQKIFDTNTKFYNSQSKNKTNLISYPKNLNNQRNRSIDQQTLRKKPIFDTSPYNNKIKQNNSHSPQTTQFNSFQNNNKNIFSFKNQEKISHFNSNNLSPINRLVKYQDQNNKFNESFQNKINDGQNINKNQQNNNNIIQEKKQESSNFPQLRKKSDNFTEQRQNQKLEEMFAPLQIQPIEKNRSLLQQNQQGQNMPFIQLNYLQDQNQSINQNQNLSFNSINNTPSNKQNQSQIQQSFHQKNKDSIFKQQAEANKIIQDSNNQNSQIIFNPKNNSQLQSQQITQRLQQVLQNNENEEKNKQSIIPFIVTQNDDRPYRLIRYNEVTFKGSHNSYENRVPLNHHLNFNELNPHQGGVLNVEFDLVIDGDSVKFQEQQYKKNKKITKWNFSLQHEGPFNKKAMSLEQGLQILNFWSQNNPNHEVITVTIDIKPEATIGNHKIFQIQLNQQITSVINQDKIFTPLQLQSIFPDLNQAIQIGKWPKLRDLKNKFIFVLSGEDSKKEVFNRRETYNNYIKNNNIAFVDIDFRHIKNNQSLFEYTNKIKNRIFLNVGGSNENIWNTNYLNEANELGLVTRLYGVNYPSMWLQAIDLKINILATDYVFSHPWTCF